jgi:hypothetical protein
MRTKSSIWSRSGRLAPASTEAAVSEPPPLRPCLKDLRKKFSNPADAEYFLNRETYTVQEVAVKARKFLFGTCYAAAYPEPLPNFSMGYRVCGYSAQSSSSEIWEFMIVGGECAEPYEIQGQNQYGLRWAGDNEALDRLILGASGSVRDLAVEKGLATEENVGELYLEIINRAGVSWIIPAMPIQDAIDVARFAVETSAKFARYGIRAEKRSVVRLRLLPLRSMRASSGCRGSTTTLQT